MLRSQKDSTEAMVNAASTRYSNPLMLHIYFIDLFVYIRWRG